MAASLMQVPPSRPGNVCEPDLSVQFRMWSKSAMASVQNTPPQDKGDPTPPCRQSAGCDRLPRLLHGLRVWGASMTWTVVRQQGLGYAVWLRWAAVAHERDQKYW